jgi:flagellar biosynthesis protein FliQ
VLTQAVVMRLYIKSGRVPIYLLASLTLSKRVHSIYVLRMFNDVWTMLLAYIALNLCIDEQWTVAIATFATSVSIKMNALLFAPGVLAIALRVSSVLCQPWSLRCDTNSIVAPELIKQRAHAHRLYVLQARCASTRGVSSAGAADRLHHSNCCWCGFGHSLAVFNCHTIPSRQCNCVHDEGFRLL